MEFYFLDMRTDLREYYQVVTSKEEENDGVCYKSDQESGACRFHVKTHSLETISTQTAH